MKLRSLPRLFLGISFLLTPVVTLSGQSGTFVTTGYSGSAPGTYNPSSIPLPILLLPLAYHISFNRFPYSDIGQETRPEPSFCIEPDDPLPTSKPGCLPLPNELNIQLAPDQGVPGQWTWRLPGKGKSELYPEQVRTKATEEVVPVPISVPDTSLQWEPAHPVPRPNDVFLPGPPGSKGVITPNTKTTNNLTPRSCDDEHCLSWGFDDGHEWILDLSETIAPFPLLEDPPPLE
ncbi:hypothetical protein [Endozoicomonas sp. ONNA1]|nr:hypothetical protein [Endozoicomonas sp. ONNA1]